VPGRRALLVIGAAAAVLLLIACYHDLRHRRIYNWLPLALTLVALLRWLAAGELGPALSAAGAAGLVFVFVALLFCQGWIGGGDVKLVSATVFLLGAPETLPLLLLTAIIGGIMAVWVLCSRRQSGETPTLPYGVAIATAAIALLALEGHRWIT
jgi:prepilin peptidase CpaA